LELIFSSFKSNLAFYTSNGTDLKEQMRIFRNRQRPASGRTAAGSENYRLKTLLALLQMDYMFTRVKTLDIAVLNVKSEYGNTGGG